MVNGKWTCSLCGEVVDGNMESLIQHGKEKHPNHFVTTNRKWSEKKYYNPLTGNWFSVTKHLVRELKTLNVTNEEFYLKYGEEHMKDIWKKNTTDEKHGDSRNNNTCKHCRKEVKFNEQHWEYPIFCSFSCSTKWMAINTNRVQEAMETNARKRKENPLHNATPVMKSYWTNKGFTEEEAIEKVKERQATLVMGKFIEKYGEEEGKIKYQLRMENWKESLKKTGMYSGYSQVSNALFEKLQQAFPNKKLYYGEEEKSVRCGDKILWPDCLCEETKTIIEFYGDYWHCNPKKYNGVDICKFNKSKNNQDIWDKDKTKYENLVKYGYNVLVIWEDEYHDNPDLVLGKCLGFLS